MFPCRGIWTLTILLFSSSQLISGASYGASSGISTTSGIVHGLSNGSFTAFLGIPYAQPPIGDLRWRTALPINAPGTEVDATRFGSACGQLSVPGSSSVAFSNLKIVPVPSSESEDCLFLNIWAPRHGQKLPVIIFVHGGALETGSAEGYYGDQIVSTGRAIFVSINYRLNIWGFPATVPVDGIDQNIGFSDTRLAVEWVAQNIAQFGGDPARIILTGHSAGASLVDAHVYAYKDDPIIVGQITASGTMGIFNTTSTGGADWNSVANSLGCGDSINAAQVSCMRRASFDSIKNSALQLKTNFSPVSDGSLIFSNEEYIAMGANGSFAHIPALITNVNDEGTLFIEPYSSIFPAGVTAQTAANLFICASALAASDKRQAGVSAWRTRYFAIWPNLSPYPDDPTFGAYHGCDVPIFLGLYNNYHFGNNSATQDEKMLSTLHMDAWLTFAEDSKDGLSQHLGWPLYDPKGNTLVKLGEHNSSSFTLGPSTQYDSSCTA